MVRINSRIEAFENSVKGREQWDIPREGVLCVLGRVPMPIPMIEYYNWSPQERLDALGKAEEYLKSNHKDCYERHARDFEELKGKLLAKLGFNRER